VGEEYQEEGREQVLNDVVNLPKDFDQEEGEK